MSYDSCNCVYCRERRGSYRYRPMHRHRWLWWVAAAIAALITWRMTI